MNNNKNVEINRNVEVLSNYLITFCVEEAAAKGEIPINIINLKNFSSPTGHPYVPPTPPDINPNFITKEDDFYLLQDNGFKIKLQESPI